MKNTLVCIKIGGSVITDKTRAYYANIPAIRKIARVLKRVKTPLIISHGSGSFGHTSAAKYCKKQGYTSTWGVSKVALDAMEINRIVMRVFVEEGLPAVSFSPMSFITSHKGRDKAVFAEPILLALKQGLLPIVYGDVIWDDTWKSTIFSGETVLTKLCAKLQKEYAIENIIELCNVDGVLDSRGKVIPQITALSWKSIQANISGSTSTDVTGGMKHKIEEALTIAKFGITTNIINGAHAKFLTDALHKKPVGTIISL